jgi:hypothetical protein
MQPSTERFEEMPLPNQTYHSFDSWFEATNGFLIKSSFEISTDENLRFIFKPMFLDFKDGVYTHSETIECWDNPSYIYNFFDNIFYERWDLIEYTDSLDLEFFKENRIQFVQMYNFMRTVKDKLLDRKN